MLARQTILNYRQTTYRLTPGARITTLEAAEAFIRASGLVFFYPIKNLPMPSLWVAVAGDRPVPDEHDDPGHITWAWKDENLGTRRWFYGRILAKRNIFISLDLLPNLYALSPNYGNYAEDYLIDYEQGQLAQEARQIYEALLTSGPLHTIALRKAAHLTGKDAGFTRAMDELQRTLRIMPVGVASAGAWHYAFIFDIVARHLPDLVERAHPIPESQARRTLIETYLQSVAVTSPRILQRLFGWDAPILEREINKLAEAGFLQRGVEIEGEKGEWLALAHLINELLSHK